MIASSRFWIASATSFAGLFRLAEHCCIVSSPVRRGAKSAFAAGKAALTEASAAAGEGCCASADVAVRESARIAMVENAWLSLPQRFRPGAAISPPAACWVRNAISATLASEPI